MADPITFPNLTPSSRSYSPGTYPQTEFVAQNGAKTVVRYGQRRVDAQLSLTFQNISDDKAAEILDNYEEVNGSWDYIKFKDTGMTRGVKSDSLEKYLTERGASGLVWRYSGPPTVASVFPGVSTVSCEFVGCLDGN